MPLLSNSSARVWFIQNMTREGPAYFSEILNELQISFSICDLERGDALPRVTPSDAVVILGGSMSANDHTPSMNVLLRWISELLKQKTSYLGVCLGLQTLVKAAGGTVVKSPAKEIGLKLDGKTPYLCQLTGSGMTDPLLKGIPEIFPIFHLHGETVELTQAMTLLAFGQKCRNQIVRVQDRAYGFQGHLEVTRQVVSDWNQEDDDLKKLDQSVLLRDFLEAEALLHQHCRVIFINFLKLAGILDEKKASHV